MALPLLGTQSRVDCPMELSCREGVTPLSISGSTVVLQGLYECLSPKPPGEEVGALWEPTVRPSRGALPLWKETEG